MDLEGRDEGIEEQVRRITNQGFRPSGRPPDEVDRVFQQVQQFGGRIGALIGLAAITVWLISGIYVVSPGEVGVVRHFGREVGQSAPGLHFRIPWPVQEVDLVNVEQIRRIEVGFRSDPSGVQFVGDEALMLTGDENIVNAQVIVQYRVKDPSAYLFRIRDADDAVRSTTEVALRSRVGNATIDDVLTVGRDQIQDDTRTFLQGLLDYYQSGILVTEVKLQTVDAPDQVKDAFNEVVRAREDRERLINEAYGYQEDLLPKARGEAQQVLRAAEAYREQRVIQAQGDVSRFVAVLEEYRKGKDVTRERLYLESMERIMAKLDKIVIDGEAANGVLPFLPLRGPGGVGEPASGSSTSAAPAPAPQPAPPQ